MKILLTWREDEPDYTLAKSELTERLGQKHKISAPKTGKLTELIELSRDADIILGQDTPRDVIRSANQLKLLQVVHAGVSELGLDFGDLKERGIILGNVSGSNTVAVAEMAMALILALAKRIVPVHNTMAQGKWFPFEIENSMLEDSTLGIIGLGKIGSEVAARAKPFGMRVIGIKRHKTPSRRPESVDFQGLPEDLDRILRESDFVVITVPATRETRGLIGERELGLMKPTAYLINVSRSYLVQEKPLAKALLEHRIAGFASDVWFSYPNSWGWHAPILSREGVHQMENVIVSPDRSVAVEAVRKRMIKAAVANIEAFVNGKPLLTQINLDQEY